MAAATPPNTQQAPALPADHPFAVFEDGAPMFPEESSAVPSAPATPAAPAEPAAASAPASAPEPAPAAAPPSSYEAELAAARARDEANQRLIDRLLESRGGEPSAPARQAPPAPGPMPDPSDPDAFQRWLDATVARRVAGVEQQIEATRAETQETLALQQLWQEIQRDEPDVAKHEDLVRMVFVDAGGRLPRGVDPQAFKQKIVGQVKGIIGRFAPAAPAAPAPAPAPPAAAAPAAPSQGRAAGLSGPSSAAPPRAAAPEPYAPVDMVAQIEERQKTSGYF